MLPHCRGAAVKPVPSVTVNMTVVLPSSPGGVAESWHQLAAFLASDLGQDSLPSLGPLHRLGKASPPHSLHPPPPVPLDLQQIVCNWGLHLHFLTQRVFMAGHDQS